MYIIQHVWYSAKNMYIILNVWHAIRKVLCSVYNGHYKILVLCESYHLFAVADKRLQKEKKIDFAFKDRKYNNGLCQ